MAYLLFDIGIERFGNIEKTLLTVKNIYTYCFVVDVLLFNFRIVHAKECARFLN